MPNNEKSVCKNCRFWHGFEDWPYGECRRNAPQKANAKHYPPGLSFWPTTLDHHWCGEFTNGDSIQSEADERPS